MAEHVKETGDGEYFGILYRRHKDRIFRHVKRIVINTQDSEEVTSDAFARTFTSMHRYRGGSVKGILRKVGQNRAIDLHRSRSRRRHLRDRENLGIVTLGDLHRSTPEAEAALHERIDQWEAQANTAEKELLSQRFVQGKTAAVVADQQERPLGTVLRESWKLGKRFRSFITEQDDE